VGIHGRWLDPSKVNNGIGNVVPVGIYIRSVEGGIKVQRNLNKETVVARLRVITFDESLKLEMLALFDKTIDEDGYIVELGDPSYRVKTHGKDVHIDDFAGVMKGNDGEIVFITSDLPSLIEVLGRMEKRGHESRYEME
jgi:hypothetical protein